MRNVLPLGLVLTLSFTLQVLSFLRPQISSFSRLRQAPTAKAYITRRQAATAIPGGISSGKLDGAAPAFKPTGEHFPKHSSPRVNPSDVVPGTVTECSTPAGEGNGARDITTSSTTSALGASGMQSTAAPSFQGQGGPSSLPSAEPEAPATNAGAAVVATATGGAANGSAASTAGGPFSVEKREEVTATDTSAEKKKQGLTAGPETMAAEKVLTLLELGLVDKEQASAYYEALSEVERATREAKAAAVVAAASRDPAASSWTPYSPQEGPLSLVPLPAICAALGAAGTHSLHLAGSLGTACSIFGAIAGIALGGLVVIGDDPFGKAARAVGTALTRSVGAAGGAASKAVSESAAGATSAAVGAVEEMLIKAPASFVSNTASSISSAAAGAIEEAVVKAPTNFVFNVARSVSSGVSAGVGSVAALPGVVVTKAADGARGALKDTYETVVNTPGEVARKGALAAGGALDAAVTAVTDSPKKAVKLLNDVISSPGKTLAAFASAASDVGRLYATPTSSATPPQQPTAASILQEVQEPEGIPVDELEAKMLSVRKALERFDAVKSRIEEARTSDSLRRTVSVTRSMNLSAEREKGVETPVAAERPEEARVNDPIEGTVSRLSSLGNEPPRVAATETLTERNPADQDRRKRVVEKLLEKASQRAKQAKGVLKAAAAATRREADMVAPLASAAGSADKKSPQEAAMASC